VVAESAPSSNEVRAYLRLADGQTLPLRDGETVVGRGVEVQARVDLPGVSRRHARIVLEGGTAVLEDLNSKNGTFWHGERVTSLQPLTSGDAVGFGSVRAVFFIASPDRSTETAHWENVI
jgi:pSer/pThr/pTyr-binding forkhead associated (FHA) protein